MAADGQGNDTLIGGAGNDLLTGGQGKDLFILAPETGINTIADFTAAGGQKDAIGLADGITYNSLTIMQSECQSN